MQLQTKYFGTIDYDTDDVIHFAEGLFAFEEEHDYLLLPFEGSERAMLCLQSVRTPALAFVLMDPFSLYPSYAPVLRADELQLLEVTRSEDLFFYALCAVKNPVADSTVNLRCPVAINGDSRRAVQVILEDDVHHMRHLLSEFQTEKGADTPC